MFLKLQELTRVELPDFQNDGVEEEFMCLISLLLSRPFDHLRFIRVDFIEFLGLIFRLSGLHGRSASLTLLSISLVVIDMALPHLINGLRCGWR
jgi:hypothetical protein